MAKRFLCYETNTPPQNVSKGGVLTESSDETNVVKFFKLSDLTEKVEEGGGSSYYKLDFATLPEGVCVIINDTRGFTAYNNGELVRNSSAAGGVAALDSDTFVTYKACVSGDVRHFNVDMFGSRGRIQFSTNGVNNSFATDAYTTT